MTCGKCKRKFDAGAIFCPYCGVKIIYPVGDQSSQNTIPVEKIIGINALKYKYAFEKLKEGNSEIFWNWSAFWFSYSWFAHRKLYGVAAGLYICVLVIWYLAALIFRSLGVAGSSGSFWGVCLFFAFLIWNCLSGAFANSLYMKDVEKRRLTADRLQGLERAYYLKKVSGTDGLADVLFIGFGIAIAIPWFLYVLSLVP